ncbi:MAG: TonB-dependent receptor [Saprospiraceae bacterium]|nr:TonB-dependent receptor [Saprospiraceae bacterium]
MKKTLLLLALCCASLASFSQVAISGKVTDESQQPLGFATIALVNAQDSQLVKGTLSDASGLFSIANVPPGQYRMLSNLVGYATQYTEPFIVQADSKNVTADITLRPAENMLGEAVVVAKRPLFEQKPDRLIMNVSDSPVASGGSALEMLQKMPGVLVVQDRVTLAGNANVQIWIDGKPSQYADMNAVLRDLPGDQIDRIELITQPGAQFDAAGGSIINIILKRNANLGFNGTAALTTGGSIYDQTDANTDDRAYYRVNPSLSLNYRKGQWNLFGSYSYLHRTSFSVINVKRFIGEEVYAQRNYNPSTWEVHNYRFGADFFATPKTTIGVLLRGFDRTGDSRANNVTDVFNQDQSQLIGSFTTLNDTRSARSNFFGNANVRHEFDTKTGHALNLDFDYSQYQINNVSRLNIFQNELGSPESRSEQLLDQPIQIYVGKVDYSLPLDSTFKADIGAKSSFATIDNDLKFLRGSTIDPGQSNDFLYKENINASYLNLSKKLARFDLNAGIRAEQTIISGETAGETVLDRNYLQWFPSASVLYKFGPHFGLQSSYSRRVNRPGFQQQNPFAFFIDSLTFQQGNPTLRPEISNNAQLALTYDNQPFIRISHSKTDDVIINNAPRLEGTKTFTTAANLATYNRWAFELNFPIKYKKLIDGFGGNQFILNAYDAEYLDTRFQRSKWNWLAYWQVNVNLPSEFKVELGGWYMTKFLDEFFDIGAMGGLNLGVSKTFWDKRGRLSLSLSDILYTQFSNVYVNYANIEVDFLQRNDTRNARLTFSYRFGNTDLKGARRRDTSSDTETSRVKVE